MKSNLITFILIVVFVTLTNCGLLTITNAVHKDHPSKCYIATNPPTILNPGEINTNLAGKCERAVCDRQLNVEIHTCADLPEQKGCKKIQEFANKPYPQCCPKLKCNK